VKEIKVAQFTGYVSEHSCYHHGEASLQGTIVGMAQHFVGSNNINLLQPNGQFGCLDPDTPILMWDSKIKKAKDIKIGDILVGDDGNKRNILKLTSGTDNMYKIKLNRNRGDYIVNKEHVLTLKVSGHKKIFWRNSDKSWRFNYFDLDNNKYKTVNIRTNQYMLTKEKAFNIITGKMNKIKFSEIIDIKVKDYLKLSKSCKYHLKSIKNSTCINWNKQILPIDPYVLGIWLGDGNCELVNDVNHSGFRTEIGSQNSFKLLLKKHNMIKNKHIPIEYIYNSKENRLQLLAGFIDTDGYVKYNGDIPIIEITQCNRINGHLIDSLDILCKSLGFMTSVNIFTNKNSCTDTKVLLIFGDNLDEIPTKVKRKQIKSYKHIKDSYSVGFDIEYIGKGKFNGWQIDGNERFLLGDCTVTHNSRIQGGKDSASPRYIFTQLSKITHLLYPKHDLPLLNYLNDDGQRIEPDYYVPIIPMILVNGAIGIGTAYSTRIHCYNPLDLVQYIKSKLIDTEEQPILKPYYNGFNGTIVKEEEQKYITKGKYSIVNHSTVKITELPIGTWTENYKIYLDSLVVSSNNTNKHQCIKDYKDHCTESTVNFTLKFSVDKLLKLRKEKGALDKILKITTSKKTTNMYLYSPDCKIKKYMNENEIVEEFYNIRLSLYIRRKDYLLNMLKIELDLIKYKVKFIQEIIDETIIIRNKKFSVIE